MTDCLFCKIIAGTIPSSKIYEDDEVLAFLDISPINPGHTLVIPKQHYVDFLDMPEPLIGTLFSRSQRIAKAVITGVGAEGFNIGMNNRKVGGQVVFHAHIHIMPRFANDGHSLWQGKPYGDGEREKAQQGIVKHMH